MKKEELIKRIMEEVKDQELKEELLRIVARAEDTKLLKRIEHRLKAQDMLAKRDVLFTAPTDRWNKFRFWDEVIGSFLSLFIVFGIMFFIALYSVEAMGPIFGISFLILVAVLFFIFFFGLIFETKEGLKAYKKLKEEEKQLEEEQSR